MTSALVLAMTTVDGFERSHKDAFVAYRPGIAAGFDVAMEALGKRLHVEIAGLDRLPSGRALVVANHTFGWDVSFPMAAVRRETGRALWALGEHLWWRVPFVRRLAAAVGTVDGTQENSDRLLANDQLVLVLPGGLHEAVKPLKLRYRLLWGHRFGFVRTAIRNQAPVVPLAAIGGDDRILPIPHLRRLRFVFGEPIPPRVGPEKCDDIDAIVQMRHEIEGALYELIDFELARRAGLDPN